MVKRQFFSVDRAFVNASGPNTTSQTWRSPSAGIEPRRNRRIPSIRSLPDLRYLLSGKCLRRGGNDGKATSVVNAGSRVRCETSDIKDPHRKINRLHRSMPKGRSMRIYDTDDPPLGLCMRRSKGQPALGQRPPSHLLAKVPLPAHWRFPRLGQLYGSRELAACAANAPITRQAHPA